jgi:quercetin dioxygenase-like cupin family protein
MIVGLLALAPFAQGGEAPGKAVALAADKLSWEELSAKRPGVLVSEIQGHHASGAWRGFLKFPVGSTSDVRTHSSDLRLVVVSGTFRYGADPAHEQPFGPGSYIFIPANHPHSNSQPDGSTVYVEQPGKYDRQGGGQ